MSHLETNVEWTTAPSGISADCVIQQDTSGLFSVACPPESVSSTNPAYLMGWDFFFYVFGQFMAIAIVAFTLVTTIIGIVEWIKSIREHHRMVRELHADMVIQQAQEQSSQTLDTQP